MKVTNKFSLASGENEQFLLPLPQGELLYTDYRLRRFSGNIIDDGIRTVSDLVGLTADEFRRKTGATEQQLRRVENVLREFDLSFR